jgi:phosphatidylinositol-3-phosphatase
MNKNLFILLLPLISNLSFAQSVPKPDHLVIIMEENRDYTEIVGDHLAPYINSLLSDTNTAVFSNAYGLVSGSQPNYLMLFSGSDQGVSGSTITSTQFTTCNLGAELISGGKTFTGYAEDLPAIGDLSITSGNYARKHNPWSNWQGTGTNQLPSATNVPFSYFPSNFDSLPTVAFVVPNLLDDMHTPSDSTSITPGDTWFHNKLGLYIQWAKTHNSMLLFAFDESASSTVQHILVFFAGQGVKGGYYAESVDWYKLLHTIEDMYGLAYCANAAGSTSIKDCWTINSAGISNNKLKENSLKIWPVPASEELTVSINSGNCDAASINLADQLGRTIIKAEINIIAGENQFRMDTKNVAPGIYFLSINGLYISASKKIIIHN